MKKLIKNLPELPLCKHVKAGADFLSIYFLIFQMANRAITTTATAAAAM